jgi:hypothetical protein
MRSPICVLYVDKYFGEYLFLHLPLIWNFSYHKIHVRGVTWWWTPVGTCEKMIRTAAYTNNGLLH